VLRTSRLTPLLYLAPMLALLLFVFAYPIAAIFDFSTRRIRGATGPFIGLENYRSVLADPLFGESVAHNALLLLAVPILVVGALLIAAVLHDRPPGWRLHRTILFIPFILAIPIVGTVFSNILQLNGALNVTLRAVGLDAVALDWIGNPALTLASVTGVIIWREIGFGIILFSARMAALNEEIEEAARLDGAGWWKRLRYVTIPQLKPVIEFYALISVITMLSAVFAYVYVMTRGGPGTATQIIELYIFNYAFRGSLPGVAAAVAVMLFILTIILVVPLFRIRAQTRLEEIE
jgi:raffinose/stachyose/melibiose transport system permease protein